MSIVQKSNTRWEIANDPKLQQMRQIAQLHQLKTNNTKSLHVFCLDSIENKAKCPTLAAHNTTSNIIAMFAEIQITEETSDEYYSFYALHFIYNKYIYRRMQNDNKQIYSALEWLTYAADQREVLENIYSHMNSKTNAIIINVWNPLTTDIVGFGVYKNIRSDNFPFHIVYGNHTSANVTDQKIIGCISQNHIHTITANLSQQAKSDFCVLMLFFYNEYEIEDSSSIIGISIPNYCRDTGFPVLSIYTELWNNWTDFGIFSISNMMRPICLLEPISYFGYEVSLNRYYESFETINYCMPTTLKIDSYKFSFDIVPNYIPIYPEPICIDDELKLIQVDCSDSGLSFFHKAHNLKHIPHLVTNQTASLCKTMAKCVFQENFRSVIPLNTNTTYIDIYLYFWSMCHPSISFESAVTLLEKGMELLKVQADHSLLLIHLAGLLIIFARTFGIGYTGPIVKRSAFTMQNIVNGDQHGLILYENKTVKSLLLRNGTNEFYVDNSVEAIVQLSHVHNKPKMQNSLSITSFIITDDYYYSDTNLTKTKLLAIYSQSMGVSGPIRVYLKITTTNSAGGYWHTIYLEQYEMLLVFITGSTENVCDPPNKWKIISRYIHGGRFHSLITKTPKTVSLDIFSQLSIMLNPSARRNYFQHVEILTIIKFITSSLSIFGIICMFLTSLLFKNWFKLRIYSNQLAISLLIQQIFFLLKANLLNHIAYVFFYYSILTQFLWMVFVGYVQYVKFIKVFGYSQFNILKSLTLGWGIPTVITVASTILYRDCLKCQFCAKNDEIFLYFVIIPIIIIMTCNLVIYIVVMVNLWTNDMQARYKKYRVRATIALPFMLGLIWIIMFTVMAPVPFISLVGWYLFYCVIPSQGFVLFIFMVLLDKDTRCKWLHLLKIKQKVT